MFTTAQIYLQLQFCVELYVKNKIRPRPSCVWVTLLWADLITVGSRIRPTSHHTRAYMARELICDLDAFLCTPRGNGTFLCTRHDQYGCQRCIIELCLCAKGNWFCPAFNRALSNKSCRPTVWMTQKTGRPLITVECTASPLLDGYATDSHPIKVLGLYTLITAYQSSNMSS